MGPLDRHVAALAEAHGRHQAETEEHVAAGLAQHQAEREAQQARDAELAAELDGD